MASPNTALLVMDMQNGIVERIGDEPLLERLSQAVTGARANGVPVIFVRVAFRDGHAEVADTNKGFAAVKAGGGLVETHESTQIHDALAPRPGEALVTKRRVSAFSGSDLHEVLRGAAARNLVLSGISTSGVVLSTLRQAADLDFGLTVLSDGCADTDPEVHRVLTEKVFPNQAEVLTVAEWTARLSA